jgi:hypothetical protein
MSTDINPDALLEIKRLAEWLSSAETKMKEAEGQKNVLECVDDRREAIAGPLLQALGYVQVKDRFALEDLIWKRCWKCC